MELFIIFCFYIALACGGNIRDHLPKCKRSDPQIEKCILDEVEKIKPMLKEQFTINQIEASSSHGAATDVKATIKNIEAHRWKDFKIENLKVNLQNKHEYTAELEILLPHLDLSSDYTVQGTVFGLNFKSYGKFKGSFSKKIASYAQSDPTGALQVVAPAINENVARVVKQFLNNLLDRVPLKNFLLD